jgi:hypothetical protein
MSFDEWWEEYVITLAHDPAGPEWLAARAAWDAVWRGEQEGKQVVGVHYARGNDEGVP